MAGRDKHAYRLFTPPVTGSESEPTGVGSDEFDEADVWGYFDLQPGTAEHRKPGRKNTEDYRDRVTAAPASLPMDIPDWSKILGEEYGGNKSSRRRGLADDSDDERVGNPPMIPPHELLSRNRGASFSVHVGMDRTHKGRDMNRLRNAVWEKFGFQD